MLFVASSGLFQAVLFYFLKKEMFIKTSLAYIWVVSSTEFRLGQKKMPTI